MMTTPTNTTTPTNVIAALAAEAGMPANCHTVTYGTGIEEGITLSLHNGASKPLPPRIVIDGAYLARDRGAAGCLFEVLVEGETARMRRALPNRVTLENGRSFFTLKNPGPGDLDYSVVKIELMMPEGKQVRVNDRDLHLNVGVMGGTILYGAGQEGVVALSDGEEFYCFFPDGRVRSYRQDGWDISERDHVGHDMIDLHCKFADHLRERVVARDQEGEELKNSLLKILGGLADVLHVTTLEKSFAQGQAMRISLIRYFLTVLPMDELSLVRKKIEAILHKVDSVLVPMLYGEQMQVAVVATATVTDIKEARTSPKSKPSKASKSARDREIRNAMKGAGGGGNGKKAGGKK